MERNFANTGALFVRQKRSPNAPDVGGDIEIGQDLIEYLNDCLSKNKPAKLGLVGWNKMSKDRRSFTSLKAEVPYNDREDRDTGQPRGYPNRGNYQGNRQGMPDRNVRQGYDRGKREFDMTENRPSRMTTQGGLPYYGNQSSRQPNDLDEEPPF